MADRQLIDPFHPDPETLAAAADILRSGGIVVYPTETLYGIGADPFHEEALIRLQAAKQRSEPKPVLLITPALDDAMPFIATITHEARLLAAAFWPGPLTLLLPARRSVSRHLTQETGRIGIRIPSSPVALALARALGGPLTSTSANTAGHPTPADIEGIAAMLGGSIDLYLDAGPLPPSKPSTVVDVSSPPGRVVRAGAVSLQELHTVIPDIEI